MPLHRSKMAGRIEVTHCLLEADMRLVHGHHGIVHGPIVRRIHAQKSHVVSPSLIVVSQRLLGLGEMPGHGAGVQMAGWTVPGSSGCASGGTGPRSGSTGNSAGAGTFLPPGDGDSPSSGDWGRRVADIGSERSDQRFHRNACENHHGCGGHTGRHRRHVSKQRAHQAALAPATGR